MQGTVGIAIRDDLYAEFILRCRRSVDVTAWINNVVEEFLKRTKDDAGVWSPARSANPIDVDDEKFRTTYGDPVRGYQWRSVFLPNGTHIRMTYDEKPHYAEVQHEKIIYEGKSLSPSELARTIANHTNRNAWRDLWVKLPNSSTWTLVDNMRRNFSSSKSAEELGL